MKKLLLATAAIAALSGCATIERVEMQSKFDRAAAEKQMLPGKNAIQGSAFLRKAGGDVVTCAGSEVRITPSTEYARERLQMLYGSSQSGLQLPYAARKRPASDADGYRENTKSTKCDARGDFSFDGLADGTWHITVPIVWTTGVRYSMPQGGMLLETVTLNGGESKKVTMSR